MGKTFPNMGGWGAGSQTGPKTPKITAFFDPNFSVGFPRSHKNPGMDGWVNSFGKTFPKKKNGFIFGGSPNTSSGWINDVFTWKLWIFHRKTCRPGERCDFFLTMVAIANKGNILDVTFLVLPILEFFTSLYV